MREKRWPLEKAMRWATKKGKFIAVSGLGYGACTGGKDTLHDAKLVYLLA
jgi:hypothetical protein